MRNDPQLLDRIRRLGPWHHDIRLTESVTIASAYGGGPLDREENDGVSLIEVHQSFGTRLRELYPNGFEGKTFLDCACNAGGYCFAAREHGAAQAVGVEVRESWIRQAHFVQEQRTAGPVDRIRFEVRDLMELPELELGEFDLTLFKEIFYHLADPIAGLKIAADATREIFWFNSAMGEGEDPRCLRLKFEGVEEPMSGVHGLSWLPTGPEVVAGMLAWLGFVDIRWDRRQPRRKGRRGRLTLYAARREGLLSGLDDLELVERLALPCVTRSAASTGTASAHEERTLEPRPTAIEEGDDREPGNVEEARSTPTGSGAGDPAPGPAVAVVVPVYNSDVQFLRRALDSLAAQTLPADEYRIVVVDDGSDDPDLLAFLADLEAGGAYQGVELRCVRHRRNRWLAEARNTGAREAGTPYVAFLDDDDAVSPDFLKKALLLIESSPAASWVYPTVQLVGQRTELRPAPEFRPFRFFFRNSMPYGSLFRASDYLRHRQRQKLVRPGLRFFEDWDLYQRLIGRGRFGVPLRDATFFYRKGSSGLLSRSFREFAASVYVNWVANVFSIPGIALSALRNRRFRRKGHARRSGLNPVRYVEAATSTAVRRMLRVPGARAAIDWRLLLRALLWPRWFVSKLLDDPRSFATLAEIWSGFERKPRLGFPVVRPTSTATERSTILFSHTWWSLGGAENILLEWLKAAPDAGFDQVIDVVDRSDGDHALLEGRFETQCDEQLALDRFGDTPRQRLLVLWELIRRTRPQAIFVSASALLYQLVPEIRRQLPDTRIVDILHNEFDGSFDWFKVSHEYADDLDHRIVTSAYWRDVLVGRYGVPPEKVFVSSNPVDTRRVRADDELRKAIRERLSIPPESRVVGFVGRLHPQKDPLLIVELAEAMLENPAFHFLIVGSGEVRSEVVARSRDLPNVSVIASPDAAVTYLNAMDVLVAPSLYEGYPLIGLEAASMNVPVIAPRVAGFREQIEEGGFGFLYDIATSRRKNVETIREILVHRWMELKHRGELGRDWVEERHDVRVARRQYADFLATLSRLRTLPAEDRPTAWRTAAPRRRSASPAKIPLILHIGTGKTGTTTIQSFLAMNRDRLASRGILYPETGTHGPGHQLFGVSLMTKQQLRGTVDNPGTPGDLDALVGRLREEIDGLSTAPSAVILSSERLPVLRRNQIARLRLHLDGFEVVRVVCYLRRQDLLAEAFYLQSLKAMRRDVDPWKLGASRQMDYARVLGRWAATFGEDRLSVTPFEPARLGGDLVAHFCNAAGIGELDGLQRTPDHNQRLSRDCLAYLHELGPRFGTPEYHAIVDTLTRYSFRHPDPPEWRHPLDPASRRALLERWEHSNEQVWTRFRMEGSALFEEPPPTDEEPWAPYPGLSDGARRAIGSFLRDRTGLETVEQRPKRAVDSPR